MRLFSRARSILASEPPDSVASATARSTFLFSFSSVVAIRASRSRVSEQLLPWVSGSFRIFFLGFADILVGNLTQRAVAQQTHPEPLTNLKVVPADVFSSLACQFIRDFFFTEIVRISLELLRDVKVEIVLKQQRCGRRHLVLFCLGRWYSS
ncbi:hypothetical protein [Pseudooceanicola nitratireducens]|jgi:hypothetical protein|uniref:hypothetical protein n=1 Tax=Pseudooceanicola nitratireducens TaxID=517719 RepID=UPI001113F93D|nr:hypothetical protein [Pseudooceanicola nitratireducens]